MSLAPDHAYADGFAEDYGYAEPWDEPTVPGTVSGDRGEEKFTVRALLREGLILLAILFFGFALPSARLSDAYAVRAAVVLSGAFVSGIAVLFARTLGGRVFIVMALSVFFEGNYAFQANPFMPSTALLLAVLLLDKMRAKPFALVLGDLQLRSTLVLLLFVLAVCMGVATMANPQWVYPVFVRLGNRHLPALLYGIAAFKMLRRGEAGVFLTLLPFLAAANAVVAWFYSIAGIELLRYRIGSDDFARYGGFMLNPNMGGFLAGVGALLAFLRVRAAGYTLKIVLIATGLFLLGTLVMLRSRGPVLLVGVLLPLVMLRKGLRVWGILAVLLAVLGYSQFGHLLSATQVRNAQTLSERLEDAHEGIETRLRIQYSTFMVTLRYPLGTGQATGVLTRVEGARAESHNEYLTFTLQNGYQSVLAAAVIVLVLLQANVRASLVRLPHRPGLPVRVLLISFLMTFIWQPVFTRAIELAMLFGAAVGMYMACLVYAQPQAPAEYQDPLAGYPSAYDPAYGGYGGA
jgi:hypothetical protein